MEEKVLEKVREELFTVCLRSNMHYILTYWIRNYYVLYQNLK